MLAAIELWSTFAQEEIAIEEEVNEDGAGSRQLVQHNFVKQALAPMISLLLSKLTKQDEGDEEDDEWNEAKAAARCLGLVAECAGDAVVQLVLPYVQNGLNQPDWRAKEAATMAFSSILEGPSPKTLQPLVREAMPLMLQAMKHQHMMVKDTTAWTIGRICEVLHGMEPPVLNLAAVEALLRDLLPCVNDTPSVAEKVCWAIHQLAAGFSDASPLTPFFLHMANALLTTAERQVPRQSRLRTTAYEALNELITVCADDCLPLVQQLLPAIMQKLGATFTMQVSSADQREELRVPEGLARRAGASELACPRAKKIVAAPRATLLLLRGLLVEFCGRLAERQKPPALDSKCASCSEERTQRKRATRHGPHGWTHAGLDTGFATVRRCTRAAGWE